MPTDDLRMPEGIDRGTPFEIEVDGERIIAYPGETIAAALLAAGKYVLRYTPKRHDPRGIFCGMGVCHDCRMIVNGQPNTRTCMTLAEPGCRVQRQEGLGFEEETR
ncbi:MAG: (2Fe-2S)-binding protein [Nitrospinota bacterium]|nr:MAG: (2Fe-2S)-binding protein [Nitrospinota bacterium]